MKLIPNRPARGAILIAGLTLAISAIPVSAQTDEPAAPAMAVEVAGLTSGDVVTGNHIDLSVQPVGYEFSAAHAGTPPVDGLGHYHVILDGGLVNMFTTPEASVSLQNVAPGAHTLMVVPAMNDHLEAMEGAVAIEFDYQPSEPLAEITAAAEVGTPAIEIVSPAPGETVAGAFDLVISTTDFALSEDLLGKPNQAGYGHWHVFVDEAEGMGTMMGMSGSDTFSIDTSALTPGPHTFIAVLTDNLHAPLGPMVMAAVEVEVAADDVGGATGDTVAVSLQEWGLVPAELTLTAGTYTFEGSNDGTIPHALALTGNGISAATPDVSYPAGESQSFTVDLVAGTYEVFCPVPGHKEAGMLATLTVSG